MNRAVIASSLLSLAQQLDDLGLSDEASELDGVASSLVDGDVEVEQMAASFDVALPRAYELWDQAGKDMGVFEVLLRDEGNKFTWS